MKNSDQIYFNFFNNDFLFVDLLRAKILKLKIKIIIKFFFFQFFLNKLKKHNNQAKQKNIYLSCSNLDTAHFFWSSTLQSVLLISLSYSVYQTFVVAALLPWSKSQIAQSESQNLQFYLQNFANLNEWLSQIFYIIITFSLKQLVKISNNSI